MNVVIIDRTRTTRTEPFLPLSTKDDLFAALDELLAHQALHTKQIEIECDKEFFLELENQAKDRKNELLPKTPSAWPKAYAGEYKDVPIFVKDPT